MGMGMGMNVIKHSLPQTSIFYINMRRELLINLLQFMSINVVSLRYQSVSKQNKQTA